MTNIGTERVLGEDDQVEALIAERSDPAVDRRLMPTSMRREEGAGSRRRTAAPWSKPRYDKEAWRGAAACRTEDPDLFFPVGSTGMAVDQIERAKAVCALCPVRSACLMFALTSNQEFGVWGGCDEDERRLLRRRWRAAAASASQSA